MLHLENNGEVRLYRFNDHFLGTGPKNARRMRMLFVDTETTGLVPGEAEVIELGMVSCTWAKVAEDVWLLERADGYSPLLQQPRAPIPPESTAVHGIRDEDVRGKTIPWDLVADVFDEHEVIVAFNAPFDRPMIHAEMVQRGVRLPMTPWACALEQIDWLSQTGSPPARNLGVLAAWHGFYFSAHRAVNDCHAAVHLLNVSGRVTDLLDTLHQMHYFVFCPKKTINQSHNEKLKAVGFRWSPEKGGWWKLCLTDPARDRILDHLREHVYGEHGMGNVITQEIPATHRFLG